MKLLNNINDESELLAVAMSILGSDRNRLSPAECALLKGLKPTGDSKDAARSIQAIGPEQDVLGDVFCSIRTRPIRRTKGQTFTPQAILDAMFARAATDAAENGTYSMIVDPGAGTGRFIIRAAQLFPNAILVAVEKDPVCAIILRARLAMGGLADKVEVIVDDYRTADIPQTAGRVLFIGNPPFVRHHDIEDCWKAWYSDTAAFCGIRKASKLAGLHIHFFFRTLTLGKRGDFGVFVTSAEWMDTNYGHSMRTALAGPMGGVSVHVIDAHSEPFPGVMTTAAITAFRPHSPSDCLRFQKVVSSAHLDDLQGGHDVAVNHLKNFRWTAEPPLLFPPRRSGGTRVGDLFRVSRGQVTGCNAVWIAGPEAANLPTRFLVPTITAASEIFDAYKNGGRLVDIAALQRVVAIPADYRDEPDGTQAAIMEFLVWARQMGADRSYIATHRKPWWTVVLHRPAPIVCTYMARRTPAFVRNDAGAAILNIAHGLYPKVPLTETELDEICRALNDAVKLTDGRVYAGGLIKFEPKAVESLVTEWTQNRREDTAAL